MPKNPYSGDTFRSAQAERELFVGREAQLQALRGFVEDVRSGSVEARVVHVFGAAGSGKSFLLAKLRATIEAEGLHPALFDIDADSFDQNTSAPEMLWQLRFSLRRAGIRTPLYDLYYAAYFSRYVLPGVSLTLPTLLQSLGAKTEPIEKASHVASSKVLGEQLAQIFDADFLKDVAKGAGEVATGLKGVQLVTKLASAFRNKAKRRALKNRGIDLSTTVISEMQRLAPEILASDLLEFASKSNPILILVDGFDRIQTELQALRHPAVAESAMEALVRYVMFSPRAEAREHIAFLYFGRQRLRWAELFDQAGGGDSWDKHVLQLPLHGFTQAEAEVLLAKVDGALDAAGEADAAQALRSSKKAILFVSRDQAVDMNGPGTGAKGAAAEGSGMSAEIQSHGEAVRYSPFRLRLCMEEIAELKRPFNDEDARRHADDICASFLRGVSKPLREVVSVFALAGELDASMYETLVKEGVIRNFTIANFPLLVRRGALFAPAVHADAYRLHYQLEDAALTLLAQNDVSRQVANTVTAKIFEQYLQRATPSAYALLTKVNLDAYQQGMRLAFRVHEAGLLSIDRFAVAFLELEEALDFDMEFGSALHKSWILRLLKRSACWSVEDGEHLVGSQLRTRSGKRSRQIIQLIEFVFHASWMTDAAQEAAKSMLTRMYAAGVLPPTDGEVADANAVTVLAVMRAQTTGKKFADGGQFDEAEAVLWKCMHSLPTTLQAAERAKHEGDLNLTLAYVAIKKRDKASAETRLEQALSSWRAANPDPTAWAETALEYCRAMLFFIGKEEPAATLFREIAPVLEAELPAMHPTRADLANTFAALCLNHGFSGLALPYLQSAKQVLVSNYGENDPRVHAQQSLIDGIQSRR